LRWYVGTASGMRAEFEALSLGAFKDPRGRSIWSKALGNWVMRRTGNLWISQVAGIVLAFLSSIFVARLLGADQFGRFTFVQASLSFLGIFFEFGLSIACGRLLALSHDTEEQANLCGAWLVVFIPIATGYVVVVTLGSLWVDQLFHMGVRTAFMFCALPAVVMPLQTALRELFQGRGSTFLLQVLSVAPWGCFLVVVSILWFVDMYSIEVIAFSYFGSFFIVAIALLFALKPRFYQLKQYIHKILAETQSFGFHAFSGRVVGVGTFQIDSPMIAYFTEDTRAVGFYGLAKAIVSPIPMLSRSIGVVIFRNFTSAHHIPVKLTRINLVWLIVSCGVFYVTAKPLIPFIFSIEYMGILPLLYVWIAAAFLQGAYQLPNLLLAARGQGYALRNMAIWFALANISLNFSLIPVLGAMGAALASAGAYLVWFILCAIHYSRLKAASGKLLGVNDHDVTSH